MYNIIYLLLNLAVVESLSRLWLFVTLWTVAHQAPLSMEFPRQESWSGLPFPFLGDLPDPGIEPRGPTFAGGFFTSWANREALCALYLYNNYNTCYAALSRPFVSDRLWPHKLQPARFLSPWASPGKNTGVGCHALLQGIFSIQGSDGTQVSRFAGGYICLWK